MSRRPWVAALGLALMGSTVGLATVAQSPAASPGTGDASPAAVSPGASPAGPVITVIALDYSFSGLPSSVPVGTAFELRNDGQELHELIIARRNDDATETWDELLVLPEEDVMSKVTFVGPLIAEPGGTGVSPEGGETTLVVDQEGSYIAVCFIPQGLTAFPDPSAAPASFGPPHAFLGMRQEFTVTAAGSSPGPVPSPAPMGSHAASPAGSPAASPAASAAA